MNLKDLLFALCLTLFFPLIGIFLFGGKKPEIGQLENIGEDYSNEVPIFNNCHSLKFFPHFQTFVLANPSLMHHSFHRKKALLFGTKKNLKDLQKKIKEIRRISGTEKYAIRGITNYQNSIDECDAILNKLNEKQNQLTDLIAEASEKNYDNLKLLFDAQQLKLDVQKMSLNFERKLGKTCNWGDTFNFKMRKFTNREKLKNIKNEKNKISKKNLSDQQKLELADELIQIDVYLKDEKLKLKKSKFDLIDEKHISEESKNELSHDKFEKQIYATKLMKQKLEDLEKFCCFQNAEQKEKFEIQMKKFQNCISEEKINVYVGTKNSKNCYINGQIYRCQNFKGNLDFHGKEVSIDGVKKQSMQGKIMADLEVLEENIAFLIDF